MRFNTYIWDLNGGRWELNGCLWDITNKDLYLNRILWDDDMYYPDPVDDRNSLFEDGLKRPCLFDK